MVQRCPWGDDQVLIEYHDSEWGTPVHDDRRLFEYLVLDGFQAGLSWSTILHKRPAFRKAFDGFDISMVAGYGEDKVLELMRDRGIVRNRSKILATINNARCTLQIQDKHGSLDSFLWKFVDGRTLVNRWTSFKEVPTFTKEAQAMSEGLKAEGFKFVGPTICYAFMQAVGMVNDHLVCCFRHAELSGRHR